MKRTLAGLLLCVATGAAASFPAGMSGYVARWDLVASESDSIDNAIEATISPMNFVARPIARSRLKRRNVAFPQFSVAMEQQGVRVRHQQGLDVLYPAVGVDVEALAPDGTDVRTRLTRDPVLMLSYDADAGRREDRYVLSEDGSRLTMLVRLTSAKLPKPLTYKLVYRRIP